MANIEVSKILPKELIIKEADSHFYRIGLSLFKSKSEIKRKAFFSPLLVCFALSLHFFRCISLICYDLGESSDYHLIVGDVDYFIRSEGVLNALCALSGVTTLGSQLINVYNKSNNIKPTHLRIFEMIAGLVSPQSIGLIDKHLIMKVVSYSQKPFYLAEICINSLTVSTFILANLIFSLKSTSFPLLQTIVLDVIHSLFWAVWIKYLYSILMYQFVYYIIIAYYLKSKLKAINSRVLKQKNIWRICKDLTETYAEINEYDTNYWSKFLLLLWLTFGTIISMLLFIITIVGIENIMIRIMLSFYAIIDSLFLLVSVKYSAQIFSESEMTYHLLHKYFHLNKGIPIKSKIKVSSFQLKCLRSS